MANLVERIRRENPRVTSEEIINSLREYLQVQILKSIYQSKYGQNLSFVGGTCLRICYDLKRYSEELDFNLDRKVVKHDLEKLCKIIQRGLSLRNIEADLNISAKKTVQKAFIKVPDVLGKLRLSKVKEQKIHIKIEIDTNPVDIRCGKVESFFVSRYNEIFPILKHDLETLFAGKIIAILCRPYKRGRDFYDLIWYLNRKTKVNLAYLNEGLKDKGQDFSDEEAVYKKLDEVVEKVKPDFILRDIGRFLEDPGEKVWIRQYQEVYFQLRRKKP